MTRALYLLPLLFLLAACGSGGYSAPGHDPYSRLSLADQAARQAEAEIRATEQYLAARGEQAAAVSTQLAAEVYATQAALAHQSTAVSLQTTALAPTQFAEVAALEQQAQATSALLTATPAQATAEALAVAIAIERTKVSSSRVITTTLAIAILSIGAALVLAIRDIKNWVIERDWIRVSIRETRSGPHAYIDGAWQPTGYPIRRLGPARTEVEDAPDVEEHGTYIISKTDRQIEPNETHALTLALIQAAVGKVGETANRLPGWRELGWPSEKWQRGIGALKDAGLVKTFPGVGTYIADGDLGDIKYTLETKQVELRPTPPGRYDSDD